MKVKPWAASLAQKLKPRLPSLLWAIGIIAAIVAADLISKGLAAKHLKGQSGQVEVIPYLFNFSYTENTGAAFSFLGDWKHSRTFFLVITSLSLCAFAYVLVVFGARSKLLNVSFALIVGGAIGNFVDRIALHYVRDFIRFTFWPGFATFNIADCALTVGVAAFAVYFLFYYKDSHFSSDKALENAGGENVEAAEASEDTPK